MNRVPFTCLLFPPEVGGNLAPLLGLPFHYRHIYRVVLQPLLRSGYHLEEFGILVIGLKLGLAFLLAYPQLRIDRIAVDRIMEAVFLLVRQGMHYRQKLTYVIGAIIVNTALKNLGVGLDKDTSILHLARVARTSGIHSYRLCYDTISRLGLFWVFHDRGSLDSLLESLIPHRERFLGFFLVRKAFVQCSLEALDLLLALVPVTENTGLATLPNDIKFVLCHIAKVIKKTKMSVV